MLPDLAEYLSGKRVFVTGVTGFVGLAVVEKLLSAVPEISNVYLLIRPKRGRSIEERLDAIKSSSIFGVMNSLSKTTDLEKLIAIEGSIDVDGLGLSNEDQATLKSQVNFVFHCAASLDFEASLKTTVDINVMGTRRVMQLCKHMEHLEAFVHVSSAYANADRMIAKEVLYPPPETRNQVVQYVQSLPDKELANITPVLIQKHPNTYTYTKALAEHDVAEAFDQIPTCIVRPSMIVGVWKHPEPGWTNSKNGPQGFIMGAAMGVIRRLPVATYLIYDYIPVDIVVNTMIAGSVFTAVNRKDLTETPIFQCTSSTYNPFRWAIVQDQIKDLLRKYPSGQAVWYPHLKLLPSISTFRISAFIFHMLPAYFFDTMTRLCGVRGRLVRLHSSVNQSLDRLAPFIFQEWKFDNKQCLELHNMLTDADKETFGLDIRSLSWKNFFDDMAHGVRSFLLNEKDTTLQKARARGTILMAANWILQLSIFGAFVMLFKSALGLTGWQAILAVSFLFFFIYKFL